MLDFFLRGFQGSMYTSCAFVRYALAPHVAKPGTDTCRRSNTVEYLMFGSEGTRRSGQQWSLGSDYRKTLQCPSKLNRFENFIRCIFPLDVALWRLSCW